MVSRKKTTLIWLAIAVIVLLLLSVLSWQRKTKPEPSIEVITEGITEAIIEPETESEMETEAELETEIEKSIKDLTGTAAKALEKTESMQQGTETSSTVSIQQGKSLRKKIQGVTEIQVGDSLTEFDPHDFSSVSVSSTNYGDHENELPMDLLDDSP